MMDDPDIEMEGSEPVSVEWRWQADEAVVSCSNPDCSVQFWLMRRRHHCRPCGKIFCRRCCHEGPDGIRQCRLCRTGTADLIPTVAQNVSRRAAIIETRLNAISHAPKPLPSSSLPDMQHVLSHGPPSKIFRLVRRIARGGFGEVFEALDTRVGDRIAVKIIPLGNQAASRRELVAREVYAHHCTAQAFVKAGVTPLPIPRLYGVFEEVPSIFESLFRDHAIWIAMELIDGDTMTDFLRLEYPIPHNPAYPAPLPRGKVDPETALQPEPEDPEEAKRRQRSIHTLDLTEMDYPVVDKKAPGRRSRGISSEQTISEYIRQVLVVVKQVHDCGFIYRDLNADNVIFENDHFTDRRIVKLVDFGAVLPVSPETDEVTDDHIVGNPVYSPPETWSFKYSFATDVWGIGCLTHELAMGLSPFTWIPEKMAEYSAEIHKEQRRREEAVKAMQKAKSAAPPSGVASRYHNQDGVNAETEEDLQPITDKEALNMLLERIRALHSSCQVFMKNKGPMPVAGHRVGCDDILCWSDDLVNFVEICLQIDAKKRPTVEQLLRHPFIRRYCDDFDKSETEKHFYMLHNSEHSPLAKSNSSHPELFRQILGSAAELRN